MRKWWMQIEEPQAPQMPIETALAILSNAKSNIDRINEETGSYCNFFSLSKMDTAEVLIAAETIAQGLNEGTYELIKREERRH